MRPTLDMAYMKEKRHYPAEGANKRVIAGLVPAIQNHERTSCSSACWIPGTSPGMTGMGKVRVRYVLATPEKRFSGGRKDQ